MIPILWRYLLTRYLVILSMGSLAIIFLLLSFRFHEMAKFAAFGADGFALIWFILYQIPYILPAVIPIASLLAAYVLANDLSRSNELTSMRACGLSIRTVVAPLIAMALVLSFLNFYLISEIATESHYRSRLLERQFKGINPLVLLKHPDLIRMKGVEIAPLGEVNPGEGATNIVVALPNPKQDRLVLLLAAQLNKAGESIEGSQVTLVTAEGEEKESFPTLFLDHSESFRTPLETFSRIFKGESTKVSIDYLPLNLLIWKIQELLKEPPSSELSKTISDLFRRISIALAPFCFTLLGIAFGLRIGRIAKKSELYAVVLMAALYLSAFFFAKSFDKRLYLSITLYLAPLLLIFTVSLIRVRNLSRGII